MRAIACGGWHSVALSTTGEVYVWGWNRFGQLGCNDRNLSPLPHLLPAVLTSEHRGGDAQIKEQEVAIDQVSQNQSL
jgi:alpha-tubulin suppressor-like RCC1 family protein